MRRTFRIAGLVFAAAAFAAGAALPVMTAAAAPTAQARTASARIPRCATPGLEVWLGVGAGAAAAGSTYYPMEFTNVTGHTCYLFGYPGVSARYQGHRSGSPARWVRSPVSAERTVTLAPGATAHTWLQITDVANFPSARCGPVTATDLKIYPPGRYAATDIPFSFRACSVTGTVFMTVQYLQPAAGIPGHPNP
jgi:hypothetical protein